MFLHQYLIKLRIYFDIFYTKLYLIQFIILKNIKSKLKKKEIKKKYSELISQAKYENGRKEFLFLLKNAAKLRSKYEINY